MVALDVVRASNDALVRGRKQPLVAVFAGATAGLGSNILERLSMIEAETHSEGESQGLRIYLIGRNQQAAERVIDKCRSINKHSQYTFVKVKDLCSISEIDVACQSIITTETGYAQIEGVAAHIDLLVCSQGGTYWKRQETTSGLLVDMTLHYYSRARVMMTFAPLLAAASAGRVGHVVNVYKAGFETSLIRNDLGLSKPSNWSFIQSGSHCQYMMTALMERMAKEHAGKLALVSATPGLILNDGFYKIVFPWWFRLAWFILGPFIKAFLVFSEEEAGERLLFLASNKHFPPASSNPSSLAGVSTTGRKGDGAYAVGRKGDICSPKWHAKKYGKLGDREAFRQEVWEHTLVMCEEAKKRGADGQVVKP